MSIYEVSHGNAYCGDPQFDNMSGRVTYEREVVGMTLDGWKVRYCVTYIDLGKPAPVDAADPDAQMQTEQLWREGKSDNTNAVAAVLAAGEARFLERRDRMADYLRTFGPATTDEMAQGLGMVKNTVADMIRRDKGATFYRVGQNPGSGGAYIWGLKEAA